jgi:hypothetical protein
VFGLLFEFDRGATREASKNFLEVSAHPKVHHLSCFAIKIFIIAIIITALLAYYKPRFGKTQEKFAIFFQL